MNPFTGLHRMISNHSRRKWNKQVDPSTRCHTQNLTQNSRFWYGSKELYLPNLKPTGPKMRIVVRNKQAGFFEIMHTWKCIKLFPEMLERSRERSLIDLSINERQKRGWAGSKRPPRKPIDMAEALLLPAFNSVKGTLDVDPVVNSKWV